MDLACDWIVLSSHNHVRTQGLRKPHLAYLFSLDSKYSTVQHYLDYNPRRPTTFILSLTPSIGPAASVSRHRSKLEERTISTSTSSVTLCLRSASASLRQSSSLQKHSVYSRTRTPSLLRRSQQWHQPRPTPAVITRYLLVRRLRSRTSKSLRVANDYWRSLTDTYS